MTHPGLRPPGREATGGGWTSSWFKKIHFLTHQCRGAKGAKNKNLWLQININPSFNSLSHSPHNHIITLSHFPHNHHIITLVHYPHVHMSTLSHYPHNPHILIIMTLYLIITLHLMITWSHYHTILISITWSHHHTILISITSSHYPHKHHIIPLSHFHSSLITNTNYNTILIIITSSHKIVMTCETESRQSLPSCSLSRRHLSRKQDGSALSKLMAFNNPNNNNSISFYINPKQISKGLLPSQAAFSSAVGQLKIAHVRSDSLNPFHPDCNTVFAVFFITIFKFIFQFLRPEQDCYVKCSSCSTRRTVKTTFLA